jgi:Flp pilus assembly protein TadB
MEKTNKLLEHFWLVFTIASLLFACYSVIFIAQTRNEFNKFYIPAISFFWWLFRRSMRRRMERNQQG